MFYTNLSSNLADRVRGGRYVEGNGAHSIAVGSVVPVWDGEVAGTQQALRMAPEVNVTILSDPKAALLEISQAAIGRNA